MSTSLNLPSSPLIVGNGGTKGFGTCCVDRESSTDVTGNEEGIGVDEYRSAPNR